MKKIYIHDASQWKRIVSQMGMDIIKKMKPTIFPCVMICVKRHNNWDIISYVYQDDFSPKGD